MSLNIQFSQNQFKNWPIWYMFDILPLKYFINNFEVEIQEGLRKNKNPR